MARTALIQIKLHSWRTWPALALRRAGSMGAEGIGDHQRRAGHPRRRLLLAQ